MAMSVEGGGRLEERWTLEEGREIGGEGEIGSEGEIRREGKIRGVGGGGRLEGRLEEMGR